MLSIIVGAGRGITVCERWRQFENFYADMGDPPDGMSLDRINNDGNYEPSNCRWADGKTQFNNRRTPRSQILITAGDKTLCLADWSRELGLHPDTIGARLKRGWDISLALTAPKHTRA